MALDVDHTYEELARIASKASDDAGTLINAILMLIAESLSLDVTFLSRIEGNRFTLEKVYDRAGVGLEEGLAFQLCDTFCHKTLTSGRQYLVIDNAMLDPELAALPGAVELGLKSYSGVIVRRRDGRVYGTLCTLQRSVRESSTQEIALLTLAARLVIQAIESDELRAREQVLMKEAAASAQRVAALLEHSSDLVCVVDQQGAFRYASPSFDHILGYAPESLDGTPVLDLLHPDDHRTACIAFQQVLDGARDLNVEVRVRRHDGCWRTIEALGQNLRDNPSVGGIVLNARDITERVELNQKLRFQALHDVLTGLPNRLLLRDRTQAAFASRSTHHCLLLIDLDGFKKVNDTLGHDQGDQLLVEVCERLSRIMRKSDTIARLGGDEFVILATNANRNAAEVVAGKVLEALHAPIVLGERSVCISASIGISESPKHGTDPDALLRCADLAMYMAKRAGGGYRAYDADLMSGGAASAVASPIVGVAASTPTAAPADSDEQPAWASLVDPDEKATRARAHLHLLSAQPGS